MTLACVNQHFTNSPWARLKSQKNLGEILPTQFGRGHLLLEAESLLPRGRLFVYLYNICIKNICKNTLFFFHSI